MSYDINIQPCVTRGNARTEGLSLRIPVCKKGNCNKLDVHNWLADIPGNEELTDLVEVRFKNTRKGFYRNVNNLPLAKGDIVAVEASPGHDIGIVSLTGHLVTKQLKRYDVRSNGEFPKIYRKAKQTDIDKWQEAIEAEQPTMLKSRQISADLRLDMKIGDVEYQGDKTKAIFYYIADERVDFRSLIKVLAEEFKIRVEMKQIGARQEAGRIGGIGSCGRELCCSTWMSNFVSVTTNAARYQELSLNPLKLAGQCGKLKCCLNYELATYLDAREEFPNADIPLETMEGTAYHRKSDIYRRMMWFSYDPNSMINLTPLGVERVHEIIAMNKAGKKPLKLTPDESTDNTPVRTSGYLDVVGQDSVTRFEKRKGQGDDRRRKFNRNKRRNKKPNE